MFFGFIGFIVILYGTSFDVNFSLFLGVIVLILVGAIRQYRALGPVALTMAVLLIVGSSVPLITPKNQSDNGPSPLPQPGSPSYQGLVPPGKWSRTHGTEKAVKQATSDRVIGQILAEYEDRVGRAGGVENTTAKIEMETLIMDNTETARDAYEQAAAEIRGTENFVATVRINGVEFVVYEGNSLCFIGSFANSLFHATYDVSSDTISEIRSGLTSISPSLPDLDLYHDIDLPEVSLSLGPVRDVLGTVVDHVARLSKQMVSQAIDLSLIAGEITGINDALNDLNTFLQERGRQFVSAEVDALAAGAGTAAEAAGALSGVAMATMDYASMAETGNVDLLIDLTKLVTGEIIEKAVTSAEILRTITGKKIGLIIDDNGVTLNLMGTHSFEHVLVEVVLGLGLERFEITLPASGEVMVSLDTGIGFSLRITSTEGTGAEIIGSVKFEGDRVRSDVQNLVGMTTGQWLTRWDWANLTISYGLGAGIPSGTFLVPGMDLQVEVSRSISENRVLRMVFDPSPEIQIQAQAGAEIEISGHAGLGGEVSLAGAVNLGLDFSRVTADMADMAGLLDPSTASQAAADISTGVMGMVGGIVDIEKLSDEEVDGYGMEYQMGPSLQLDYLNAVSHHNVSTSEGNYSALEMDENVGQVLAGYVYEVLGKTLGSVAQNTNIGLCLKGKAGVGVGAGTTGGEVAADFEIGLEGGLNVPTQALLQLGVTAEEARQEMVDGLCQKGFRLITDPGDAGFFIDQPTLLLDADTLTGIILSLSDFRLETELAGFLSGELSDEYQSLKTDQGFLKKMAGSDLYFQLSIGAKGSAELGLGTEVEAALQVVLHNNGETILNNMGIDTEEFQKTSLSIGVQIGPPSLEVEVVPGTNLFVEAAIGADFLQIELSQKTNKLENIVDLFSEIFPTQPRTPVASIKIDQDTWTQPYAVGETAEKTVTVQNTGSMAVNLVAQTPVNITSDIPRQGLHIGAGNSAQFKLIADTSTAGTTEGAVHLFTGFEDAYVTITVNLITTTGTAQVSVDQPTWRETVLRGTPTTRTFRIDNTGGADYVADVVLPAWATPDKTSVNIPAQSFTTLKINLDTAQDTTLTGHLVLRSSEQDTPQDTPLDTPLVSITVQVGAPQIGLSTDRITEQLDPDQATTTSIAISNTGIFDLAIDLSGDLPDWIEPDRTSITVPPGQDRELELGLTATSHSPSLQHELVLVTNDPDQPQVTIIIRVSTSLTPETLARIHIGSHHVAAGGGNRLSPFAHGNYVVLMGPTDRETAEGGGDYGGSWDQESVYVYDTARGELRRISPDSKYSDWPIHRSFIFAGPAVHGDRIVYGYEEVYSNSTSIHYHNYEYTYYLYDLVTGENTELDIPLIDMGEIDETAITNTVSIDIYENLIVGQGNEEIWIYDLDNPGKGAVTVAREKDPTGPLQSRGTTLMFSNPVIHGDKVVYVNTDRSYATSNGYYNHTVWMLDLSTMEETYLGWSKTWVIPRISESHVAYGAQLSIDYSDCQIVIHDIQTGQTTYHGRGPHSYPQLDIYRDQLVYMNLTQQPGMSLYDLYQHDASTGQTLLIAPRTPAEYPISIHGPRLPTIYRDKAYYLDVVDGWTYLKTITIP